MTPLLEARGVSVSFGGLRALTDVGIAVPTGAVVGLIGPNGAGKTTFFNVLSGLQKAAGTVTFDGRVVSGAPPHRRARLGIGRSFQNLGLMRDETVGLNLLAAQHLGCRYGPIDLWARPWRWWRSERALATRVDELLGRLDLAEHRDVRVSELSFGIARFVEIAAVLAAEPRLLLLDEPTTGLDVAEVDKLAALLRGERAAGRTVLVVAHDVQFVMGLCDEIHVLAEGRNIASGSPAAIQSHDQVIDVYLGRTA